MASGLWLVLFVVNQNCRCCLKSPIPSPNPETYCVSGVKNGGTSVYSLATNSSLDGSIVKNNYFATLLGVTNSVTLHIFVDHSIVEVYANAGQGSVVMSQVCQFVLLVVVVVVVVVEMVVVVVVFMFVAFAVAIVLNVISSLSYCSEFIPH